jgi:hypothetical protein
MVVFVLFFIPIPLSATLLPSSISLKSSQNPSALGQAITLTATVTPSNATGSVTFYEGVSVLAASVLADGQATFTTSLLASGSGSLYAYYSGDLNYAASTSAIVTQTVNAAAAAGFAPLLNYPGGVNGDTFAAGDFNGDGKADLVIADTARNTISVFLGNGDGTFQAPVTYISGTYPAAMALGDFNGDGASDIAVGNWDANSVSIFLGNGDGTFRAPSYISITSPAAIAVGDFNADGKADLAVTTNSSQTSGGVSVFLGNGDGTFAAPVNYVFDFAPATVLSADFNGDGKADLLIGSNQNSFNVNILLGNGDGTFQPINDNIIQNDPYLDTYLGPRLSVEDFNGDGKTDLAFVSGNGGTVIVLLGNGDGTFQPAVNYATNSTSLDLLAVGDFNGDGHADIFEIDTGWMLLGNGDGTFQPAVDVGTNCSALASDGSPNLVDVVVTELNGDGRTDVAFLCDYTGNNVVSVLLGATSTNSVTALSVPVSRVSFGQPLSVSATVEGSLAFSVPVGTVNFLDGSTVIGTETLLNGSASFTTSSLAAGLHTLSAGYLGDATTSASNSSPTVVTILKAHQTISLGPLSNQPYGAPPFLVSGTASSGLEVSFHSQTKVVCRANGNTVTLLAVGTCTIQATQAGNANYLGASPVSQSFQVTQATQTIDFGPLPNQVLGAPPFMVNATASSGLKVSFISQTKAVCRGYGTTVTLLAVGTCTIQAMQVGNADYSRSSPRRTELPSDP